MPYTLEQCKKVMRETQEILNRDTRAESAKDARTEHPVGAARAAATAKPPSAEKLFLDYVVDHLDDGHTLPESIRLAAIAQPNLHQVWLQEQRAKRDREDQTERERAARIRGRNS